MRYIVSREEMQKIDAYSIQKIGIPGIVLMEKAALAMERVIAERFPVDQSVLIVVERGNNGGDGLALGRLLSERGYPVTIYEIGGVAKASESYQIQAHILEGLGIPVLHALPQGHYDIIIDGIFGVGLTREVRGIQREVIEQLNQADSYRIAVDVPSGVASESGQILGIAFQADMTITFGFSKIGLMLYPGAAYSGEVLVQDIGFPELARQAIGCSAYSYDSEDFSRLPQRKAWSNKGSYGKVLIIAGSKNMAGAACLCAEAAYRSGSGLVRVFTCEENRLILQNQLPEAILTTYEGAEDALSKLSEAISWASVIACGPGLGVNELTAGILRQLLREAGVPLVLDADAINTLARLRREDEETWQAMQSYEGGMILTPHLMEMSRLCGRRIPEIQSDLIRTATEMADEQHIMVLKDARTIVADGQPAVYINTSGNHGMSVGGSGDVLTGIICGLLACGADPAEAARLGVYCHGLAGDEAVKSCGHYGLLARDLLDGIKKILP